jgi:hypothetical protein
MKYILILLFVIPAQAQWLTQADYVFRPINELTLIILPDTEVDDDSMTVYIYPFWKGAVSGEWWDYWTPIKPVQVWGDLIGYDEVAEFSDSSGFFVKDGVADLAMIEVVGVQLPQTWQGDSNTNTHYDAFTNPPVSLGDTVLVPLRELPPVVKMHGKLVYQPDGLMLRKEVSP